MNLFNSANKALITCLAGPSSFSARQYGSSATRAASSLAGKSTAVPGYGHFTSPLRKVHLDYHCDSVAQRGLRAFIRDDLVEVAKANPDVEFVVRRLKQGKAALLRGHYVNGRDKVVCVNSLDRQQVANKLELILSSGGGKIKHLKNIQLEAGPGAESARGVWSGIHSEISGEGYRV
ncbi:hypothetical protein HD553DRAFT_40853 [Filobasidium floriforme]|uniref:uncharacterized protein n=1 Tax=Filobasidium floriforme TaxID=5210 RepID=UPI001E8EDF9F|nr:uncharacterized protein HD553DRAFT_40853 [Filobasidium floriforme]KAH8084119.1 hypothetical protein HD553DRAFT_40853 [Filobasidium floriforme]